ncbi:DMT family transporter [Gudongella oleilytica]|uniref:DMT family transporter n=1 Tax=Gudongella oleilytica TaxID=1582259 RepID=UPI002A36A578|nr:DMT family transporter [Gudongella oleilytica]MDY0257365.1 DMT family transporter [Gudongella oleilytica]
MNNYLKGVLLVLASAFAFSFLPIFVVFAYDGGADANTLLLIRFSLATVVFFSYLKLKRYNIKLDRSTLFKFFLLGVFGYTLQSRFFFMALKYITPAIASMFLYTYPVLVSIITYFVDKEKPSLRLAASIVISSLGLVLVMGASMGSVDIRGVGFALLASLVYSLYIVASNKLIKRVPAVTASAYIVLFSAFGTFIIGSLSGGYNLDFEPYTWIWIIGIALVCSVIAMITFFKGMEYIGPTKTSIISLTEAVYTVVLSAIMLQQFLTVWQLIGGAGVLFGAYLVARA